MSYEQPFNGDYDHQDLFGVGERVWLAWWDPYTGSAMARAIIIKEIRINEERVWYVAEYLDSQYGVLSESLLEDQVIYETAEDALSVAEERLALILDAKADEARREVEYYSKKLADSVVAKAAVEAKIERLTVDKEMGK